MQFNYLKYVYYNVIRIVSSNIVTWMMNSYFVIVSSNDTPVYEADFFKPEAAVRVKI